MRSTPATNKITLRAALLLLLLSGAACSDPLAEPLPHGTASDTTPVRGGTLRLSSFADIRTLDPAASSDQLADEAVQLIFAGLVDFDAKGAVFPDLAEKIERSDDGLIYTFTTQSRRQILRQHRRRH